MKTHSIEATRARILAHPRRTPGGLGGAGGCGQIRNGMRQTMPRNLAAPRVAADAAATGGYKPATGVRLSSELRSMRLL
jgi:hypothetical protein